MQISSSPRILVVDDEPNVLLTVEAILKQEDYAVDACGGGAAAIAAIRERHYDLVLTDLKMPEVDGLAVLAEVRKRSPNTVTVMMTGFGSVDSAIGALQLGAYEYLLKPTEVPELKAAVRRALERKRFSEIDTLYSINRALTRSLDPAAITNEVCDATRRVLGLGNAHLFVFDRNDELVQGRRTLGQRPGATQTGGATQGGQIGGATEVDSEEEARYRQVLTSQDSRTLLIGLRQGALVTSEQEGKPAEQCRAVLSARSFALLPGIAGGRLACVLCADNGDEPYEFHASALRFLQALVSQTAMALENASLVDELKRNNEELAAANNKLRELDTLKSQFLSVATHELRTPLSVILGYNAMLVETLEDRLTEDEKETLRESVVACKRLIRLVNSMLDINQIESGKMKMTFAPANLRNLVEGIGSLFQHEASKRNIAMQLEVPSKLPRVTIDAERMQQVLINLVGNALKFTGSGGAIRLAAAFDPEEHAVRLSVSDTGIGIAPEDQARIFDEFAQIRRHNALRQKEGSGLGLAISKRIVEAHDGSIHVSSEPGKGSTFTVTVPARIRPKLSSTAMSA